MSRVGFAGLGNMGAPMALNLIRAGHEVHVYDIVASAAAPLLAEGAIGEASAAAAAVGANVFFSMLPAGVHARALYQGEGGVVAAVAGSETVLVDCSTIDAETARANADAAAQAGVAMLDAPVSGGVGGAEAGTLSFMVGGDAAALERVRPYLDIMGSRVFHAGGPGAGQIAKICNNMLLSVLMSGTAEALNLGVRNGLDPAVLSEIMKASSGGNWALNVYNPWPGVMSDVPASRGYSGGFAVDLMLKDLRLALAAANASGTPTPMGSQAHALYGLLRSAGGEASGRLDFSSIQQLFEDA